MDGDGGDAEFLARALNAQCDLTPVCDQYFVEHSLSGSVPVQRTVGSDAPPVSRLRRCPPLFDDREDLAEFDRLPVLKKDRRNCAGARRRIWFMVFMASMMSSVSPCCTRVPTSMNGGAEGSGER